MEIFQSVIGLSLSAVHILIKIGRHGSTVIFVTNVGLLAWATGLFDKGSGGSCHHPRHGLGRGGVGEGPGRTYMVRGLETP